LVENILKIYREPCHKLKESPADAAVIGSEVFNVPENIFLKVLLRDLDNWEINTEIDREGLNNAVKIQKDIGVLGSDFSVENLIFNTG